MPGFIRRCLNRKTLIRTGVAFGGLALLITVFYAEENWRGRRAWDAYREAAGKRGVKLFLKDFIPADIPDSENYAAIPVIRDLFVKQENGDGAPNPFKLPIAKLPDPPNDIKARRLDLAGWQEFFVTTKLLTEKSNSPAADILHALEHYEPALQQLRDASTRPKCKFPTHWEDGPATPLPHLFACRSATVFLCLRANANLALGRRPAALAEIEHGFRLHAALGSELSLIAGLVRIANLALIENSVWDGLAGGQWNDEELNVIENRLAGLRTGDDWRFALASERGFVNASLLIQANQSAAELERAVQGYCIECSGSPLKKRLVLRTFPKGWMHRLMIRTNDYFDWLVALYNDPGDGTAPSVLPTNAASDAWSEAHHDHPGVIELEHILMVQSQLVFDGAYKRYLYTHTRVQQTRLACMLERFRHAKGRFPGNLAQLVPDFVAELPKDLFDGKPIRYRGNADGGYDLWSIGPDRKDDGGTIDPKETGDQQADWIWHMPGQTSAP